MADDTTQGQDRVAEVVARVVDMGFTTGDVACVIRALDAAGLLLTEERRKRLRDHLSVLRPVLLEARLPKTCEMHDALLRELAGESAAPVAATPEPARPRRMQPTAMWRNEPHDMTHDENEMCARMYPPCEPVAEPEHDPRDFAEGVLPIGTRPDSCPHTGAVAVETVTTTTHTTEGELRLYTPPTATMRVTALYCPTCRVRIEVGHG